MLEVQNLKKTYFTKGVDVHVLHGISLTIQDGEFVAITGRSGAGKSTLMYQMSLLDHPTSGAVIMDGEEISLLSEKAATKYRRKNFGFVFQDYALVPELNALENIVITMLMSGVPEKEAEHRSMEALSHLGIEKRSQNLPSQLSGGEQQRVSIARAISNNPRVLFADEPTASLDSKSAEDVMSQIEAVNARGHAVIMVTHEGIYAERAKRVIELHDGEVVGDRAGRSRS